MPKYQINYAIEKWYCVEVEAESEQEALSKFHRNEHLEPQFTGYGDQIEDTVEIQGEVYV